MAIVANAQVISFTETAAKGSLNGKTFGSEGFVLTVTDKAEAGKLEIDANNANFGTLADYQSFTHRLKTGGKSSSSNNMSLSIPADGTLKVYARTASKDSERPIVITQNGTEVFNQKFVDSQAATENYTASDGSEKVRTVFPIYTCEVKAGTADITYPDNGVNFYCFELVSSAAPSASTYEATITSDPENDYYSGYEAFDMKQVISALGLADEAALKELLATPGNVYYKSATGELSNAYTGNANEFWMNANGVPQGYGDEGTCWYAGLYYDEAGSDESTGETWESEFYCKVGQMPKYFGKVYTDSELNTVLVLKNGDKQIEVSITLKVNAAPEPQLPTPETELAKLNIVKEYDAEIEIYQSTQSFETVIEMPGICDALGISQTTLGTEIKDMMFGEMPVEDPETHDLVISDNLVNIDKTDAWFGRTVLFNELTGEETIVGTLHSWGAGCTIYLHNPSVSEETLTFKTCGQYGTTKGGDVDKFSIYMICGDKAAKVNVTLNTLLKETVSFDKIEWVERKVLEAKANVVAYGVTEVAFDLQDVLDKLGAESVDEITEFNLAGEGSFQEPTINDYWQGEDGISVAWSASAVAKVYPSDFNIESGKFTLMQMARTFNGVVGPCPIRYYFVKGTKGYEFTINYTVDPDYNPNADKEFVKADEQYIQVQIKVSTNGNTNEDSSGLLETVFDNELIAKALEVENVSDLTFCANTKESAEKGEFNFREYVVGTAYWMDPTGNYIDGWNSSSAYGMVYTGNGSIKWYQFSPNGYEGVRIDGDHYTGNFYMLNKETNKYVKIILDVYYVDELGAITTNVGTETIVVKESEANYNDAEGNYTVKLDMTKAYEALGITNDEIEACSLVAPKSYSSFVSLEPEDYILYDENGYVIQEDKQEEAIVSAQLLLEDGEPTLVFETLDVDFEKAEPVSVTIRIGLEYDHKRYIHVITMGNEAAVSISAVTTQSASAAKKVLRDGKVMIIKGANEFGVSGALIK